MSARRMKVARSPGPSGRSRDATGRGGTSLPGKVLLRMEPDAIGRLAAGSRAAARSISATNGKTTTAAMVAAILERDRHAPGPQPRRARTWPAASPRRCSTRGGRPASSACSRSTSSGSARVAEQLGRARCCWPTCSATSSTATASSRRSPTAGHEVVATAAPAHALVLNADDPLVADLGRDLRRRPVLRRRGRRLALPGLQHAADSKHCRRCGAPYVYDAVLPRPPRPLPLPDCGTRRARSPRSRPRDVALDGVRARRVHARTEAGERRVAPPAARPLQRLQRARRRRAGAQALGASLDDVVAGLEAVAPAFGRAETHRARRPRAHAPAHQEPGRRQRGAAHAAARAGRARPLRRAQRQDRRRPRRLLGVGRRLRAARRPHPPHHVLGHPRRRARAAAEVRRASAPTGSRSSPTSSAAWTARAATAPGRSTPCPPTPRCSRCATCSPTAAPREASWAAP